MEYDKKLQLSTVLEVTFILLVYESVYYQTLAEILYLALSVCSLLRTVVL